MNKLRRCQDGKEIYWKNDWMSFYPGFRKINFTVAPAGYFDNRAEVNFSLGWGQFYINIPFILSNYDECDPPRYGFYFYAVSSWWPTTFVICKGRESTHIRMPWDLDWVRTSILLHDGSWEHETKGNHKSFYNDEWKEKQMCWTYDYVDSYDKEVIPTTIYVEEREWRPKWFKWTKMFSSIERCIDVHFSKECGKRKGSWKGGTLGCGYRLLPNEEPLECLKRMEKERKF